jgi:hypothetical protein
MTTIGAQGFLPNQEPFHPLRFLQRQYQLALLALLITAIVWGCIVEMKGALLHNRHTDAGAYFSAAWSVRIGSDPYCARDRNGWHYLYPPLLAVLMGPFADAPPTMHRYYLIPYAVSVGAWYVLSVLFLVVGVEQLSKALLGVIRNTNLSGAALAGRLGSSFQNSSNTFSDRASAGRLDLSPPRWAWRWWILFFWPVLLCLPAIFRSVVRGQVGPLWLMLLCLTIVGIIQKKEFRAGMFLAGAICLKLIPLFLLLYPLWRRKLRMLVGAGAGMILGLVVIPLLAMGKTDFVLANQHYFESIVFPGATGHRIDPAVENELMNPITSDTQSFVTVLMDIGHIFLGTTKGFDAPRFAKAGHLLLAVTLVIATLWAAGWQRRDFDPIGEAIFFAILCVIMLPIAPTCHPHYFMLMIPLVMAVLATFLGPQGRTRMGSGWLLIFTALPLSHILTSAPPIQFLRDIGLVTWTAMALAMSATVLLHNRRREFASDASSPANSLQIEPSGD